MSVTQGSLFGLLKKASTGKGYGKQGTDDSSIAGHAKFMHSMYQKDGTQQSDQKEEEQVEHRQKNAQKFVDSFYTLVTDFYESGWGQSFHFAPRGKSETFSESIVRHEYYLAMKLDLKETDFCLDMGCGIGGPMRNIHQFTNAKIVGITINDYQVKRGNVINAEQGLQDRCLLKTMDYTKIAFNDCTFDKAFAIESTCHSPQRTAVFGEAYRILKPGALFVTYEWVLNSKVYDPSNKHHVTIRRDVEKGNALPELITETAALEQFREVGFEVVEAFDLHEKSTSRGQRPWYHSLEAKYSLENVHHTYFGTLLTHYLCWAMETCKLAPPGTLSTHEILLKAKNALILAGQTGIFTPMFMIVGRKPLDSDAIPSDV